jgi:hypothetical protein
MDYCHKKLIHRNYPLGLMPISLFLKEECVYTSATAFVAEVKGAVAKMLSISR